MTIKSWARFELGWFSNRTGTSNDNGARKSNNWLDQWLSENWLPEVEFSPFHALSPSSNDVPVLLLNQPYKQTRPLLLVLVT